MRRILEWLGHINNSVTFATWVGLPVTLTASAFAAFWAYVQRMGTLSAVLIFCFIFVSVLWSWIGTVWLWDRSRPGGRKTRDSSWGVVIDSVFIAYSPGQERFCQFSATIRNVLSWPLRVEVDETFVQAGNRVPDQPMNGDFRRVILQPNLPATINFPTFSRLAFPDTPVVHGRIRLSGHYGHPDGGHTRTMKRWLLFEHPNYQEPVFPPGFTGIPFAPQPVRMALICGPEQDDVDEPYKTSATHRSVN